MVSKSSFRKSKFLNPEWAEPTCDTWSKYMVKSDRRKSVMSPVVFETRLVEGFEKSVESILLSGFGPRLWMEVRLIEQDRSAGELRNELDFETGIAHHLHWVSRTKGLAKAAMRNLCEIYLDIGIWRIDLEAGYSAGGWVWAKYGFVPSVGSWRRLRESLKQKILDGEVPLNPQEHDVALKAVMEHDPRAIWTIADLGGERNANIGASLLSGTEWFGSLDFADDESLDRLLVRLEN
jgi:hypothetical protein